MRNLRCWLFGHEWVVVKASIPHFEDWSAETAVCGRCEAWIEFCDGDCGHEECGGDA